MNTRLSPVALLVLPLLLQPARPAPAAESAAARFAYQERDRDQEQQTFLRRLKQDKAKLDLAVENTKRLIDRSRQRPYLPELYLRLAELYVEKSRVVFFIRKAELPKGVKSLDSLESNTLKKQALEVYQRILGNHPEFPDRDKVRFFMAHEYRELGQIDAMVGAYEQLIREHPGSRYVPEAQLLLGDHHFNSQDLEKAARAYAAVLEHPSSPAAPIARYKLAWCHINTADFGTAIHLFEEAVRSARPHDDVDIDTYRKVDIRLESLIDMAYCYCEEYKDASPEEAVAYFERHAWSRPSLTTALEKLANRYFIKKKWDHAASVYRKLSGLQHDPEKLLSYAARVFECARATGSFAQADQDVGLMVKALKKQQHSVHLSEEDKQRRRKEYELYARDIVTHLHQKALESQSLPEFELAAAAYETYLGFFRDSGVRDEMRGNYAESLFAARRYVDAGKQFEAMANDLPGSEREREQHLYSAVLAYYSALKDRADLDAYAKTYARAGLRSVGQVYVNEYPTAANVPKVLFNVAWVAYDEGDFAAAVEEFAAFAERYPGTPEARAAIHLVLDAHNLMEEFEALVAYGRQVLARDDLDGALRREVAEIVSAAESKVLYPLALAAADDWETGREKLTEFADAHAASTLGEQALQAVVASAAELGDLVTLFPAAQEFVSRYPHSERLAETLNLLVDTCVRAHQYRRLAYYLEEFAYRLPEHPTRAEVLWKAAQIRERLADYRAANADYTLLLEAGIPKGVTRDSVVLAAVAAARRSGDAAFALTLALENEPLLSGSARIRNLSTLAELYRQSGDAARSRSYREKALGEFQRNLDVDNRALVDAVAEMEFHALEGTFDAYMTLQLNGQIDNTLVQRKGDLYGELLKAYHKLMQRQSPAWALAACFRAAQLNAEFARFLLAAPTPDLPGEQAAQYAAIVAGKAGGYREKAAEYRAKGVELARKWEVCDAELAAYFLDGPLDPRPPHPAPTAVDADWLERAELREQHLRALRSSDRGPVLAELAVHYVGLGDYRQAALIAEETAEDPALPKALQASLFNTLGVARWHCGQDALAKEAFQEALRRNPGQLAARVNLAGLYRRYEHADRAQALYAEVGLAQQLAESTDLIHPISRELYDELAHAAGL